MKTFYYRAAASSMTGCLLLTLAFTTRSATADCDPPKPATFTVHLPKVGLPPDDEGQGWDRPPVWEHHPNATDDSITVPNGRPIYALIVSGYASNRDLDELMLYNFARHLMAQGAYVHFAWWNNLLAPYMERPLHHSQSHPGNLDQAVENFQSAKDASHKAAPGEDYQFVADAKRLLTAIRQNNPNAMIIVAGHSMGGGAVVHLGAETDVVLDILAPIDPVGNRNYPWAGVTGLGPPVRHDYNFTRWRVSRDNFLGYKTAEWRGIDEGCVAVGPWLKDASETENSLLCANVLFADSTGTLRFDRNIINLHHRYQKEFFFPFDYWEDYPFGHTRPPGGTTSQAAVGMTPQFCGGLNLCEDPGGWPSVLSFDSPCCQTGVGVGWPRDGHGEIVGYRGPLPTVPLGVRLRTSPQCGDCPNQTWPARSESTEGVWSNGNGTQRASLLRALENLPAGAAWEHRPTNPDLCLVSSGLINRFENMNRPPTAHAGDDQLVECTGTNGTAVQLNGSASSDPDNDTLEYNWTWSSGNAQGVTPVVTLARGIHCLTLTVRDPSGHIDIDTVQVTVQDTTPPKITVTLSPQLLWPPNHKMVTIYATVDAQDLCGQVTDVRLLSIVSNEADNGIGDGNTKGDIVAEPGTLDVQFQLRAERAGPRRDRIYTVTYQATDDSGNQGQTSTRIIVPHNATSHQNWLNATKPPKLIPPRNPWLPQRVTPKRR